jgi:hypothetical protein
MRHFWLLLVLSFCAPAQDFPALLSDRQAVERVYHAHRTGTKAAFEEAVRPEDLRRMVETDLKKEAVLKQVYGLEIGTAEIQAEAERISGTTRAPGVLAELKAALGNEPSRFASTVVKPLLVDRRLRELFENDPKLHLRTRETVAAIRAGLLKERRGKAGLERQEKLLKSSNGGRLTETTWSLWADTAASGRRSQGSSVRNIGELSPELRTVLETQLRHSGDVSAVVEAPSGFLLFLARDRTERTLTTACLYFPKQDFEQWLCSFGSNSGKESKEERLCKSQQNGI